MKGIRARLSGNAVIDTLIHLEGNARPCLYLEPLWGIPYNLYLPFVSVYMSALGLPPTQIGLLSTLSLVSQMVWSLLGGVLTDKLGRRLCTLIFDTLSWSVPTLLWMLARDVRWFAAASILNGAWRVTETSWGLLLIEDAPENKLVHLYTIASVAGLVAGFAAPLSYAFVQHSGVVPTMRFLYGLTCVLMTTKFVSLYFLCKETSVGLRRMAESRGVGILRRLWDGRCVLKTMLHTRRTMLAAALIACQAGMNSVNDAFWPLLVTQKLGVAPENLSIFSTVKTLGTLLCYFLIAPRLDVRRFRYPVATALVMMGAQQCLMLFMPAGAYALVLVSVCLEAVALSILSPMLTSLQMLNIDREERARMLGFFYAMCMLVTSPLSTLAGMAAEINRALPFAINLCLTAAALLLTCALEREGRINAAPSA